MNKQELIKWIVEQKGISLRLYQSGNSSSAGEVVALDLTLEQVKKLPDESSQPQSVEQDELATELVRMVINSPSYGSMVENVLNNFTLTKIK